jgi:hypothetical protein
MALPVPGIAFMASFLPQVQQSDLEAVDNCLGKYTVGLGQVGKPPRGVNAHKPSKTSSRHSCKLSKAEPDLCVLESLVYTAVWLESHNRRHTVPPKHPQACSSRSWPPSHSRWRLATLKICMCSRSWKALCAWF